MRQAPTSGEWYRTADIEANVDRSRVTSGPATRPQHDQVRTSRRSSDSTGSSRPGDAPRQSRPSRREHVEAFIEDQLARSSPPAA